MKKTTYWVIGMFITAFVFSIGVMIYFKYFEKSIAPISAKFTTMNVNNVKVLKIDDSNTNNHRSYYNLEIVSANTTKMAYPKDWIKAVQKGDTLILSLPKDEKKLKELYNNFPKLVFSIGQSTKSFDLISSRCISDITFKGLKLNQCSIKGNKDSYSNTTIQTCTIDKFDIAAGGNIQVPDSKIKSLQLLVDNSKLINATKYDIENLYLTGSNDDPSEIDLTKIKHVYLKPSKGKTIATRTSSNAEIYSGKD